jgi:trimeric autotransporter adhesin
MAADWTWGLRFIAYGYPGAERSVSLSPRLTTEGARAEYHWGEGLTESLRNGPDGLEQTFVLALRPAADGAVGPLGIALRVAGSLQPRLVEAGEGVSFGDADGVERLAYRGLVVSDATGQRVPAWFELREGLVRLRVDDREAVYPLTVDPIAQQTYLKASNTDAGDEFGLSVAISGDTVVVGAHREQSAATGVNGNQADNSAVDSGAAYVFVRSGGTWSQEAYLKASNTDATDNFGSSVAISGDTVVTGAAGEASVATGVNGNQADNTAAYAGAAYVFARSGRTWSQQAYLKASNTDAGDGFGSGNNGYFSGSCVSVSGDTVVVGAPYESSATTGVDGNQADNAAAGAGAAYVFTGLGPSGSTTSTVSTTSTSSTTLPGCAAIATFASIDCRLDALVASLNAAQDLGRLKSGLAKAATKARSKKQQAEGFVATEKKKQEKNAMKKAVKALSKFLHIVGSRSARKVIPAGTREMLSQQTNAILADMKTLLGTL